MDMTTTDIVIAAVIGLSMLFGAWRGFVREVLSLLTWIAAIVLATMFTGQLLEMFADQISKLTGNPSFQYLIGYAVIFLGTLLLGGFITSLFGRLTEAAGLKFTDRLLGMVFGLLRGAVIVTIAFMLIQPFESVQGYFADTLALPYLLMGLEYLQKALELLPDFGAAGKLAADVLQGGSGAPQ